jgi:MFS family permease
VFSVVTDGLHRPPAFLGILSACQGLGSILGGLAAPSVLRRVSEPTLMAAGALLAFAGKAAYLIPAVPSVLAASVCNGIGLPWVLIGLMTLVQRTTPGTLQGRVNAALSTVVFAPMTLATAVGAGVLTLVGYRPMLVAGAVITLAAAIGAGALSRRNTQPA